MAKLPDISKLSPKELDALIDKASEQREAGRQQAIEALKAAWKKEAAEKGLTVEEVFKAENASSGKGAIADKPCSICGFKTAPLHDARKHRWTEGYQGKAFTSAKLNELGLRKVT